MKAELQQILKNRKLLIPILAVLFIPVLYAGMFLWAFWDPYEQLKDLPVAIVNEDAGATVEGETLQLGSDVTEKLVDGRQFYFQEMTEKQAEKALENKEIYMMVHIPSEFSDHVTTLYDEQPSDVIIDYVPNEGYNFLSAQIGDTAMEKVRAEVNKEIVATYSTKMIDGIDEMKGGITEAADAATKFADGTNSLSSGTTELKNGVLTLKNGATQFQTGFTALQSGITSYTNGVNSLSAGLTKATSSEGQLVNGISQASAGATSLTNGASKVAAGNEALATGIESFSQKLAPVLASLPEEQANSYKEALAQMQMSSKALAQGANDVSKGASQLSSGLTQAESGANKLYAAHQQLSDGAKTLESKSPELSAGATKLSNAATQLAAGSDKLVNGSEKVENGARALDDNMHVFADELEDGATEAASKSLNGDNTEQAAAPVSVVKSAVNHVPNYGSGFAPYFLSLGLFVGALLISIVFPLVLPAGEVKSGIRLGLSKAGVLAIVGVVQALLADAVLIYGLGLDVSQPYLFVLLSIVTSFAFLAIVQLLVSVLGDPGRFVAIVILILQLTTSAGTFPLELIPTSLQPFNAFLPMTYSVEGMKDAISSTNVDSVWQSIGVLAAFMAGAFILTLVFFQTKFRKNVATTN
ncbi:YhgE/Pip domain-containing protein [Paenisporosarcina cavernae]|uniref:YhgE/Pip domain-containing protein n=1 Tax=Paenisporosarcina cavernae TaxID=2320858 RepID=A0A385YUL2_9BACL|nr:YhgE/Pip domain-containing protein [Paenisporosarcina cavernae]AYC30161.1 YhgE/Pip domain-containing protein [Paenisporosarcina cavernae]